MIAIIIGGIALMGLIVSQMGRDNPRRVPML